MMVLKEIKPNLKNKEESLVHRCISLGANVVTCIFTSAHTVR